MLSKINITYILALILSIGTVQAQFPWELEPSRVRHEIFMESIADFRIGDRPLKKGDAIGVFYSRGFSVFNGGYAIVDDPNKSLILQAHGHTFEGPDGFMEGEALIFKVWLKEENCIIDDISIETKGGSNAFFFTPRSRSELSLLTGEKSSVEYPSTNYCSTDAVVKPIKSTSVKTIRYEVTSGVGLSLNEATGDIDLSKSALGTYEVSFITEKCLKKESFAITIDPVPERSLPKEVIVCKEEASITLQAAKGNESYLWSTGETTNSINVKDTGVYRVKIKNASGCQIMDSTKVSLTPHLIDRENLIISMKDVTCTEKGEVFLEKNFNPTEKDVFTFTLSNLFTGMTYSAKDSRFKGLDEGLYVLKSTNDQGCEVVFNEEILIGNNNDCKYPVITPNGDGISDQYFIEKRGQVEIFTRYGKLIKKLNIPAVWDGTDAHGNILPMGSYILIINEQEEQPITLVR